MELSAWAADVAKHRLSVLPGRFVHTRGVAATAAGLAFIADGDADLLIAAAWLHDVGYAPGLVETGFHPLDGARYLRSLRAPGRLTRLVARHSCSIAEARFRGLEQDVEAFADEGGVVRDALWYCDMTTSPEGVSVTLGERLKEIQARYGEGVVSASVEDARPHLTAAIDRTMRRLREVTHDSQL